MITITTECAKCHESITETFVTLPEFNIAISEGTTKFSTTYYSTDRIICRKCMDEYEQLRVRLKEEYHSKTKQWWDDTEKGA